MPEQLGAMEGVAAQIRLALEAGDLTAFSESFDPNVTWGATDAPRPTCQNRDQVLAWYERGRQSGVEAQVSDIAIHGDKLLVSLVVHSTQAADQRGGSTLRWQVLTVRDGRVVDIVGFDDRSDAVARL